MTARVLVAGIGNLFLGDDGFGPEVVRRLAAEATPPGVRVTDYGIRGMHLAYDLLAGYDALILVDALPGAGPPGAGAPGDVVVLEISADDPGAADAELPGGFAVDFDAHGMNPAAVLAGLGRLGGTLPRTYLVGCRAATVTEGIGLSEPVAAAIPEAIAAVRELVARLAGEPVRGGRA
ncbi:MAG TPA: hydrogenase maturation protease [Actinoplanes sp.]|nr:hydrogenase maturation protease [Actinoplanes sp.]